ncbi:MULTISPECIES: hypothetical protein [Acinetobacter]|uniref:Uncharacterized protein n=1 Tax=Acinetobacter indicus TaxID=756892 RepID=A0A6C0Y7M3_9GAMM|nr:MULTISPECIES: hypothetical protein [Acinetobacter]QIC72109.1 hypothetical protein FSC09_17270 [Acinetobacter indicus]QKQ71489.1 hypothetical protein E5Y90_14755 [Acinetobacter sp. 10FS3-1]
MSVQAIRIHLTTFLGCLNSDVLSSQFNLDEISEHSDRLENSQAKLIEIIAAMQFSGIIAATGYGKVLLSPSAKEQGLWQVTTFNDNHIPLGDLGNQNLTTALEQFFEEISLDLNVEEFCSQFS